MKLKNTLIASLAMASLQSMGQTLPASCEAYLPKMLNKTTIFKSDVKKLKDSNYGQNGSTNKYWDVYSDRCDNALYSSPNGSKTGKTLEFNQKVRIAKIQNGWALVFTENKSGGVKYPQISGDKQCLGWLPMDNLLLWGSCPTNEYGIYQKALIVRNLDQGRDASFGRISQHPDPSNTAHTAPLKSSIDFHYIMKEEKSSHGTRYLIAKYNKLDGTTDQVIEGWVSENSFSPWNQRSCLEPNWNTDDVEYFISKGEKAWLYENASLTSKTQPWTYGQKNKEGQASTQYRMPPRAMRFPILDNESKSDKTFKITAFGAANGELGQQMVVMDNSKELKEKHLQQVDHINIIVVMDGTRSMGKYFPAMAKAVKEATQYLDGDVSVGAVIYRDYTDGEKNVIEIHKMTRPNDASLQSFLTNIGRNGYGAASAPADRTAHEAMYLGIKTALETGKMGYSPNESNLVFIIGDCGNDPADNKVTLQEIQNLAHKSQAQLFSFQVLNQDKQPWDDFNNQLTDLFVDQMKHLYTTLDSKVKVAWRPVEHGLGVRSNTKEHFYSSEMHRGQVGKELSEGELNALIQESYKSFRKAIEEQKKSVENMGVLATDGSDDKSISINEEFLKRKLGSDYDAIVKANSLLAYSGYARQDDGNGRDYWQAVVFLSSEELVELIKRLEPLKVAAKTNTYTATDRDNYVKAITGIIQSMTEKSAAEIDQMSTDDITRLIGGLNVTTPMLTGKQSEKAYTLAEIKNPAACPDEEFKKILKKMSTKIENLSELPKSSNFKYSFTQNGVKSYWVPLSMIP